MCVRILISVEAQDPLASVRNLLRTIWIHAELDGLFIAHWQEGIAPQSELLTSPDQLEFADPFAPVMFRNSASDALRTYMNHPDRRLAFMLRPCEQRCFSMMMKKMKVNFKDGILISSDCLATFPPEDYIWKLEASEDRMYMTLSALHFAAQGGLQPSRYRNSCQFCDKSYPENVDLTIELLGIKTTEYLVLKGRTPEIFTRLGLDKINGQSVPEEITRNRERTLKRLADWRQQALAYTTSHLEDTHKTVEGLVEHLIACSSCLQTLQNCCPLFELEWIKDSSLQNLKEVETWLRTCSGCGMCESKCPDGFPLFSAILFLSKALRNR